MGAWVIWLACLVGVASTVQAQRGSNRQQAQVRHTLQTADSQFLSFWMRMQSCKLLNVTLTQLSASLEPERLFFPEC
jgi:hypothetical protein